MTSIFIRFVNDASHAQDDMARRYSYRLYQFFSSVEAALESDLVAFYGVDPETIRPAPWPGEWGFALEGLCGFEVDAETVEEAIDEARRRRGYNGQSWPFVAVFEGEYVGEADAQDGDVFCPIRILATVEMR